MCERCVRSSNSPRTKIPVRCAIPPGQPKAADGRPFGCHRCKVDRQWCSFRGPSLSKKKGTAKGKASSVAPSTASGTAAKKGKSVAVVAPKDTSMGVRTRGQMAPPPAPGAFLPPSCLTITNLLLSQLLPLSLGLLQAIVNVPSPPPIVSIPSRKRSKGELAAAKTIESPTQLGSIGTIQHKMEVIDEQAIRVDMELSLLLDRQESLRSRRSDLEEKLEALRKRK